MFVYIELSVRCRSLRLFMFARICFFVITMLLFRLKARVR